MKVKYQGLKDWAYGLANFSGGIVSYAIGSFYMFFYVDQLGLGAQYYAIAMFIYGVWNAINDPIAGYFSDRTKTRWGRRKPYIMFGAIPLMISFALVFMPPEFVLNNQVSLFIYFLISMCVYDTFFTIVMLNWSAVLPEMYLKESDRSRVGGIAQVLGVIGAVGATVLVQPIVLAYGYGVMSIIFAIIGGITMLLSCYGIRENEANMDIEPLGFKETLVETFKNRSFRICVSSVLIIETAKILIVSSMAFYTSYVLVNDLGVTILMGAMFLSSIIFTPIIIKFCKMFGAKSVLMSAIFVYAVGSLGLFLAPNIVVAAIVALFLGYGVSGTMIVENVLYAQIIDEDQLITGKRREGAYFGINALVMRLSVVFQGFFSAFVLSASGYISGVAIQSASAVFGIRVLMGLAPFVLCVLGALVLRRYPLYGKALEELKTKSDAFNKV